MEGNTSNQNLRSVMLTWGFTGQDSNFKSLISTGAVEYIDNDSLTLELTRYYVHNYALINDISEQYKQHYFCRGIDKLSKIIMTELNLNNQSNPLSIKLHRIKIL